MIHSSNKHGWSQRYSQRLKGGEITENPLRQAGQVVLAEVAFCFCGRERGASEGADARRGIEAGHYFFFERYIRHRTDRSSQLLQASQQAVILSTINHSRGRGRLRTQPPWYSVHVLKHTTSDEGPFEIKRGLLCGNTLQISRFYINSLFYIQSIVLLTRISC